MIGTAITRKREILKEEWVHGSHLLEDDLWGPVILRETGDCTRLTNDLVASMWQDVVQTNLNFQFSFSGAETEKIKANLHVAELNFPGSITQHGQ